ncbi:MAG: hypothetical protein RLZZ519_1966 [Bacteroidota bacterium]|jgi:tRNA threonylcarbamoyl adenosine modification protein YjeE
MRKTRVGHSLQCDYLCIYAQDNALQMGQPLTQDGVTSIETQHPDDVRLAAAKILESYGSHRIFAFYGTMGAGKTTLIKAICELLGSEDVVKSPTFSIVNEYDSPAGSIFHFDFYRIENLSESLTSALKNTSHPAAIASWNGPSSSRRLFLKKPSQSTSRSPGRNKERSQLQCIKAWGNLK